MTEAPGFLQVVLMGFLLGMSVGAVVYVLFLFRGPTDTWPELLCRDTLTNSIVPCPVSMGGLPNLSGWTDGVRWVDTNLNVSNVSRLLVRS